MSLGPETTSSLSVGVGSSSGSFIFQSPTSANIAKQSPIECPNVQGCRSIKVTICTMFATLFKCSAFAINETAQNTARENIHGNTAGEMRCLANHRFRSTKAQMPTKKTDFHPVNESNKDGAAMRASRPPAAFATVRIKEPGSSFRFTLRESSRVQFPVSVHVAAQAAPGVEVHFVCAHLGQAMWLRVPFDGFGSLPA